MDSLVLLDLVFTRTDHRPPVVFVDTQLEFETTRPFVEETCARYGAELHVATSERTPEEVWAQKASRSTVRRDGRARPRTLALADSHARRLMQEAERGEGP